MLELILFHIFPLNRNIEGLLRNKNIYHLGFIASLAVDGNFSTCSSTKETTDPRWWKLTLGQTQLQIKGVSIRLSSELQKSFQEFSSMISILRN